MPAIASNSIRLAVLGAGYWGTKLCKEYAAIESSTGAAQLSYVVDSSEISLKQIERELAELPSANGRGRVFSDDYEIALNDREIEAVHIALPNPLHYQVARAALEAGKHVLLEKPIATTSKDAFDLAHLAKEKRLVLQVGHIFRFNNAVRAVKEIIRSGRLGKIFYANLSWATYMRPIPTDRDIIFDLAPHPVDVLNYLLEGWPIAIEATGDSYVHRSENREEMAFVNLEFPEDVLASIYLSWIHWGPKERSIKLICERGMIHCDALSQEVRIWNDHNSDEIRVFPPTSVGSRLQAGDELTTGPNNTIREMQYHFLERIGGRGAQLNGALSGAENVVVLENITSAIRARKKIEVPPLKSDHTLSSQSKKS